MGLELLGGRVSLKQGKFIVLMILVWFISERNYGFVIFFFIIF